jgi:hypothetical protein
MLQTGCAMQRQQQPAEHLRGSKQAATLAAAGGWLLLKSDLMHSASTYTECASQLFGHLRISNTHYAS